MRDIRFRAWHNEAEQYCEGSTSNMFQWLEDGQPVILEQYTGLKDCEGTEIYEGDIVECPAGFYWVVGVASHGGFVAHVPDNLEEFVFCDDYNFKVIGSIHTTPELLK